MKTIRHFYNNITRDPNLKNGAEKTLIKMFSGWTVMMNRDRFDSGLATIACESGYSKDHIKKDVMPSLIKKGYITLLRCGYGKQHSQYMLNIPAYYVFPDKQVMDEATRIKLAKRTLVKAGADIDSLNKLVASGMADRAIKKAKIDKSLKNTVDSEKKQNSLKALLEEASS